MVLPSNHVLLSEENIKFSYFWESAKYERRESSKVTKQIFKVRTEVH